MRLPKKNRYDISSRITFQSSEKNDNPVETEAVPFYKLVSKL